MTPSSPSIIVVVVVVVVVVVASRVVWVSTDPVHSGHRDYLLVYGLLVRP